MAISLPTEIELTNIDTVIILLKAGCFITYKNDPRDGEIAAYFQNTGPCADGYEWRNYPVEDFLLLKDFLELDSVNLEFGDWHYYWHNV